MKIFFILPYKSENEDVYEIVKFSTNTLKYTIQRADDFESSVPIQEEIEIAISEADIVIADVSDFQGNVVTEFSIAKTLSKPILPILDKNKDLSFDMSHYQVIIYDRLRLQTTLAKPLLHYLTRENSTDFLRKKTTPKKTAKIVKSIFISYSHMDAIYLERLKIHLKPFEKKGQIDLWEDTKIKGGDKWKDKINKALDKSVIAILLISADFLASDFIVDNELPPLLKAAEEKGKIILPVIVKPCRFTSDENLSKFQSINEPKYPLSKLNDNDKEEIYVKVADLINNLVL